MALSQVTIYRRNGIKNQLVLESTYQIFEWIETTWIEILIFGKQIELPQIEFLEEYKTCLGYVPISSSAPRPLGAAYVPILLSEVEQEQRHSGNGDMPQIMIVNQLEASKERFRTEGLNQIRQHSIRSLQLDQKVRPLFF